MAANKMLDPTTCKTAEEAFKYPIPQVRQLHRTLIADLDEKNAQLRNLVGGSYRQLLGTAETIVQMKDDIGRVEHRLGVIGRACGKDVLEGMVAGLGKLDSEAKSNERRERMGWVARMKVLRICAILARKLLRKSADGEGNGKGRNVALAAKVWVLGELLAKSVGDNKGSGEEEIVQEARRKSQGLKKMLLYAIERALEKPDGCNEKENLVQALCAYSLTKRSGAQDVLEHFLRIRGQAITTLCSDKGEGQKHRSPSFSKALKLYTQTLSDVQALVPQRLSEALAQLKSRPILIDSALRELEGLQLDLCEKWVGDQILFFTAYIIHDDLEESHAVIIFEEWANRHSEVLLQGLGRYSEHIIDAKTVVDLRTSTLEVWIREGGKPRGFDPSVMLDGLRGKINNRMVQLFEARVNKLHLVGTEIESTLSSWQIGITGNQGSLWEDDMLEMKISNGAALFKQAILARTQGRHGAVSRAVHSYQTWRHLIDEVSTILTQLRRQRWDEDLEDMEDEETLRYRNRLLSQDDPQMLQARLDQSLINAFEELHAKITSLLQSHKLDPSRGHIIFYILRIIRNIRSELPNNPSIRVFGLSMIPSLHQELATLVSHPAIQALVPTFSRKKPPGRALWEGTPELPTQPSPSIFRFLYNLTTAMAQAGGDLWSPAALRVLKAYSCKTIAQTWTAALEETPQADGTELQSKSSPTQDHTTRLAKQNTPEEQDDTRKELLVQTLFDLGVLECAFHDSSVQMESAGGMLVLSETLESRVGLEPVSRKRLLQGAKDYWRRSGLLFGILGA